MSARRIGVLLAAGRGRRMGALKQVLPWGPPPHATPLVAAAFDALHVACEAMVVVVGRDQQAVLDALAPREFAAVRVDSDAEMFASVRAGLRAVEERAQWEGADVLLHLADHPIITSAVLTQVLEASKTRPGRAAMPEFRGKGGHPVFIPRELVGRICEWSGSGGLRAFWEKHPTACCRIPVKDAAVVLDLDTRDEYEDSLARVSGGAADRSPRAPGASSRGGVLS